MPLTRWGLLGNLSKEMISASMYMYPWVDTVSAKRGILGYFVFDFNTPTLAQTDGACEE